MYAGPGGRRGPAARERRGSGAGPPGGSDEMAAAAGRFPGLADQIGGHSGGLALVTVTGSVALTVTVRGLRRRTVHCDEAADSD